VRIRQGARSAGGSARRAAEARPQSQRAASWCRSSAQRERGPCAGAPPDKHRFGPQHLCGVKHACCGDGTAAAEAVKRNTLSGCLAARQARGGAGRGREVAVARAARRQRGARVEVELAGARCAAALLLPPPPPPRPSHPQHECAVCLPPLFSSCDSRVRQAPFPTSTPPSAAAASSPSRRATPRRRCVAWPGR
jgi:hypothetical protein